MVKGKQTRQMSGQWLGGKVKVAVSMVPSCICNSPLNCELLPAPSIHQSIAGREDSHKAVEQPLGACLESTLCRTRLRDCPNCQ